MKKYGYLILMLLFSLLTQAQQRGFVPINVNIANQQEKLYDQSHALLIGISQYTNGWNNLPGVKRDIVEIRKALEISGFNVIAKENLTKAQTDNEITSFIANYGQEKNNRLLIYFAGHGFTVTTTYGDKLGYFVPTNAPNPHKDQAGFQAKALEMAQMEIYAKRIQSKHALFLFDACFAGSLFAMRDAIPAVIDYKTKEPVRQFITSGSENESVPDESIFRAQFVRALTTQDADANTDGYLTGTELGKFLQDNVVNYSYNTQHPQYGKIRHQSLDKGDFVFVLPKKPDNTNNNPQITEKEIITDDAYGSLSIVNYIEGSLYIDGSYEKSTSKNKQIEINKLKVGEHLIEIRTDNRIWKKSVSIVKNQMVSIKAKFDKELIIKEQNNQFTDTRDGKEYKTVVIGGSTWMNENLAFKTNTGCWSYKDNSNYVDRYGYLYNWSTATQVCPNDWHLPTKREFQSLVNYYGNEKRAFVALSTSGTDRFSAIFCGIRDRKGKYRLEFKANFWTSEQHKGNKAWYLTINKRQKDANLSNNSYQSFGMSVRCVKNK